MKKSSILIILVLPLLLCSCGKKQSTTQTTQGTNAPSLNQLESKIEANKSSEIDVDLTKMSSTIVYAEIFNMLIEPEEYENKIIKLKGNYYVFYNENTNEEYKAVLIPDATACCQQGIEFIFPGEHKYPEIGTEITVVGQYKIAYTEDDIQYCYLVLTEMS